MGRPVDRDSDFMLTEHGTDRLITDYNSLDIGREVMIRYDKALRQLSDSPSVRNADDYDDWEYGTEPIPHDHTWTRKRSS